ncbi:phosphoprotein [Fikirini virus]|uniref:Phosphoprotein n=1 Tax=Fikirini virus TaxID=1408144 RepID=U5NF86_9RHAB|nr:phosphoprotein [Fikirini virus]AGY14293.1 phosphoprotein [Fikirini virus]
MDSNRQRIQQLSKALKWDCVQTNLDTAADEEEAEGAFETAESDRAQERSGDTWEKLPRQQGDHDSYTSDSEEEADAELGMSDMSHSNQHERSPERNLAGDSESTEFEKEKERQAAARAQCKSVMINRVRYKLIRSQTELDDLMINLSEEIISSLGLSVKPELSTIGKCSITMYYTDRYPKPPSNPGPSHVKDEDCPKSVPLPEALKAPKCPKIKPNTSDPRRTRFKEVFESGIIFKKNKSGSLLVKRSNPAFDNVDVDQIIATTENNKEALKEILRQGHLLRRILMTCKWPEL